MNKYNNSKIYKITSKIEPYYYYIGSTTLNLKRRLTHHKSNANKYPDNIIIQISYFLYFYNCK